MMYNISLRSRRLEVVGAKKNLARERETRVSPSCSPVLHCAHYIHILHYRIRKRPFRPSPRTRKNSVFKKFHSGDQFRFH